MRRLALIGAIAGSSAEAFKACNESGVLGQLLSPLSAESGDVLLQMNILELLPACFCGR
jgi:hypothetical protein